ncbi:MAG: SUMF1/EgtB/PvdO family nonheme iron enzyme [Chloroflexota bacterium]
MSTQYRNAAITIVWIGIAMLMVSSDFFSRDETSPPVQEQARLKAPEKKETRPRPVPLTPTEVTSQLTAAFTQSANLERMILIPRGSFKVEPYGETPWRQSVFLPDYYIDKFEVTVAEYAVFVNALNTLDWTCHGTNCPQMHHTLKKAMGGLRYENQHFQAKAGYERRPITAIDWQFANLYCHWAGKRLPTNAEWEKAARGTIGYRYPWGNNWRPTWADEVMMINAEMFPLPIGSRPNDTSPYGVIDMMGNATEWVADAQTSTSADATAEAPISYTRRGVTAIDQENGLLVRNKGWSVTVGFRCAVTLPDEGKT